MEANAGAMGGVGGVGAKADGGTTSGDDGDRARSEDQLTGREEKKGTRHTREDEYQARLTLGGWCLLGRARQVSNAGTTE